MSELALHIDDRLALLQHERSIGMPQTMWGKVQREATRSLKCPSLGDEDLCHQKDFLRL
jgi:hypothetical protein